MVLERPRACLFLSLVRTFTRKHAFVSDSRVGLLLLPIPFPSRHRPLLKVSRRLSSQMPERRVVRRRMARFFRITSIARRRRCRYSLRPLAATFLHLGLML